MRDAILVRSSTHQEDTRFRFGSDVANIVLGVVMTFLKSCFKIDTLVGGFNPSEKYEFVSWDDEIPNIMGKS